VQEFGLSTEDVLAPTKKLLTAENAENRHRDR
jgi:hypothetical protein